MMVMPERKSGSANFLDCEGRVFAVIKPASVHVESSLISYSWFSQPRKNDWSGTFAKYA
jgi:hypothetical protein